MRNLSLGLLLLVGLLPPPAWARESGAVATVLVYQSDGTRHCDPSPGIGLDAMAQELRDSGISVYAQRKSHDGREGVAVCGKPTGGINVFEIAESDLARAERLGFQRLDPAWLPAP